MSMSLATSKAATRALWASASNTVVWRTRLAPSLQRAAHRQAFAVARSVVRRHASGGSGTGGSAARGFAFTGLTAGLCGGALGYSYRDRLFPSPQEAEQGLEAATQDHDIAAKMFEHPFNHRSLLFRWWLTARRMAWLAGCFFPLAAASALFIIFPAKAVRKLWLRVLEWSMRTAGCTFQKFGQWMSMRPDMLPADVIAALEPLRHGEVPEHSAAHNRATIRESFGAEVEEVFSFFDEKTVASGTVAQVHRARMAGSGEEVAVKIRHPAVLHETFVDIHLIFAFMKTLGPLTCGNFTIPFSRHDFHAVLQRQTDFTLEAENLARFRRYFDGDALVVFPSVSHVSDAVLVESWAPGVLISEGFKELGEFFQKIPAEKRVKRHMSESLEKRQANSRLAEVVFSAVMKMFLRDNFIHGDLHGGNVIRSSLPSNAKVTIIDAGVVTSIAPAFQPRFHAFLQDLCQGRPGAITDSLLEFHIGPPRDRGALLRDIEETCARWVHQGSALERGSLLPTAPGGGPVMLGDLIGEILFKVQRQKLHLRGDVASTIVSMSLVEGMVKQLDPDFDVVGSALPYFKMYAPHSGLAKL